MKITITLSDISPLEAEQLVAFAGSPRNNPLVEAAEEQPQKPRRRRRSKEEMAEARAIEATEPASQGEDDPPTQEEPKRRRRRSASEDPSTAQPAATRRRRRKGAEQDQTDEITDRDVAKAASEGAQELTPAPVRKILDQFGVSNVADLDQRQRREFIDLIDNAIEDALVVAHENDERGC